MSCKLRWSRRVQFRDAIEDANLDIEIIGVGGIFNATHVRQYLSAGATAVQLATAPMLNPLVAVEIKTDFAAEAAG